MRFSSLFLPVIEHAANDFNVNKVPGDDSLITVHDYIGLLDNACRLARAGNSSDGDIAACLFAVVAWIDEKAMTGIWSGATQWRVMPLQKHYFATTCAGVDFFSRLKSLPLGSYEVREVYALVLIAGFVGCFSGREKELETLRADVISSLVSTNAAARIDAKRPLFPALLMESIADRRTARWRRPQMVLWSAILLPLVLLTVVYALCYASLSNLIATTIGVQ